MVQPKAIVLQQRQHTAPPVYRPQQSVIAQAKMTPVAHAHAQPNMSSVSRPQSPVSYVPGGIVQMAKKAGGGGGGKKDSGGGGGKKSSGGKGGGGRDYAVHNWDNILAQYREGQAAREVIDEFAAAGYYGSDARTYILKAMRTTTYANTAIAHALGKDAGGLRGGTDDKIQDCKKQLIAWARLNKASAEATPRAHYASSSRSLRASARDEEAAELQDFYTTQLAGWAKRGDLEAMKNIANKANHGNELAWAKLLEMARSSPVAAVKKNAISELSRLADEGNELAWKVMLSEFQVHSPGSAGGALPEGYTPPPSFHMGQAGWRETVKFDYDPWEHVQGAAPEEWDD